MPPTSIANGLRDLADAIEAGKFDEPIDSVVILISRDKERIGIHINSRHQDMNQTLGIIEFAKIKVISQM